MAQPLGTSGNHSIHRFRLRLGLSNFAISNVLAEMILAAVSLSTDFAYAPTNDQVVAVFIGVILFHGLLNTLNTAWLARITSVLLLKSLLNISIIPSLILDPPSQLSSPFL